MTLRVAVADDDPDYRLLVRLTLAGEPDMDVVGEAAARAGRKVLAFGNGGSATDAQDFVHDLVEQHRAVEDREAGDEGKRQPEIPAIEIDDGGGREQERREIAERDHGVQQRPPLMEGAQLFDRQLIREIALELLGVVGVVVHA